MKLFLMHSVGHGTREKVFQQHKNNCAEVSRLCYFLCLCSNQNAGHSTLIHCDMVKHELRVTSYELRATSYELIVLS